MYDGVGHSVEVLISICSLICLEIIFPKQENENRVSQEDMTFKIVFIFFLS